MAASSAAGSIVPVGLAGLATIKPSRSGPAERYQVTLDLLRAAGPDLEGLIVASPANPTGTMLPAAELAAIADYCRGAGIRLISDEIYHGITYGAAASTALAHDPQAIVVNSFSKYFS